MTGSAGQINPITVENLLGDPSGMEIVLSEPLTGFANKRFNTSTWKRFEYSAKESRNANNDTLGEQHWTKAD